MINIRVFTELINIEKCSDMKMEAAANDSTEKMPAIKAPLFLGWTSGSFLTGLSSGLIIPGKEYNTMAILTGVLGTSLLGYTSFRFWTKEGEIKFPTVL